jgi:PAS domain-containing protein
MSFTQNKAVLNWVDEMAAMCKPDNIVWVDGSEEQLSSLRKQALATGELIELEQFGTGKRRFSLNYAAPVRDPAGNIIAGVVAQLDVTDRIVNERATRENEEKFRAVFEKSAVGMARVRFSDGRWIDVNEAFCQMLGTRARRCSLRTGRR